MKCVICGQAEYKWVKGKRYVFCPACGIQAPNVDGKIKVVGRPPKSDILDPKATRSDTLDSSKAP